MVRLTRIYTRTGDRGSTRLVDGQQVDKDSIRVEAYGTVDELNSILGMIAAALSEHACIEAARRQELTDWLHGAQRKLFDLGSDLATPAGKWRDTVPQVRGEDVETLESVIDRLNSDLEPLESFVLPGGGRVSSQIHHARTVCRRAERRAVTLAREHEIGEHVIPYLNRLSDTLFVLSRWVAKTTGESELLWRCES